MGTKLKLNSDKAEQLNIETLSLSGSTKIYGGLTIESGSTFTVKENAGLGKVFTSDVNGNVTLQSTIQPYLSLTSGSTVTWDVNLGLNMMLTIGGNFTLVLNNLQNGMSGDLRLNVTTGLTITLPTSKINGVKDLTTGVYHLAWVYAGTNLDFNIAKYI